MCEALLTALAKSAQLEELGHGVKAISVDNGVNLPSGTRAEGRPPPELIVFQRGRDEVRYILTGEKIAYRADSIGTLALGLFHPEKVAYLVEPLAVREEPETVPGLFTMIAAFPDPVLYKQFVKTRGRLYMPTYQEEELVAIGQYLKGLSVRQRFEVYGGIFPRVLCRSKHYFRQTADDLRCSICNIGVLKLRFDRLKKVLFADAVTATRSYIVNWNPAVLFEHPTDKSKMKYNFCHLTVQFASVHVEKEVEKMCDLVCQYLISY
eukprot:gene37850-45979_t